MASHPQTFVRIQKKPAVFNQGYISCDINADALLVNKEDTRGEYPTKIQGWEILIQDFNSSTLEVRFRNPLGVFLGVDTIDNNSVVKANAGLDDNSLWKLESDGKISITDGSNTLYMTISGTGIRLTASAENATLWGTDLHPSIPPLFHNPSA
ncbi:MAG TPA: hypothetical protein PLW09_12195 [Candidatus Kapabacteria bacterium]|nr:hypothetical protein [Candidatus Kapabacteria bacterium]